MRILLLAVFSILVAHAIAQNSTKQHRNLLSITYSINDYFDGNAVLERVARYPILGLEYVRQINPHWGIAVSSRFCLRDYEFNSPRTLRNEQVRARALLLNELDCIRKIYGFRGLGVFGMGGVNFRFGQEHFYLGRNFWGEPISENYNLRDFGISAGIRLRQQLPYRFVLTGQVYFTEYVRRYFKESYPNRKNLSTRHMLSMQVGLGYQF